MDNDEQKQAKRIRAYELRLQGKTWRDIGSVLGVGHETARRWVKDHLDATELPLVDEVRKTEVDRLLRMLDALENDATSGDPKAVSLVIKISERLCKMLGADAPQQIHVEKIETTQMDLEIQELIRSQSARNRMTLDQVVAHKTGENTADQDVRLSPPENNETDEVS
jgi:hypothetical protein